MIFSELFHELEHIARAVSKLMSDVSPKQTYIFEKQSLRIQDIAKRINNNNNNNNNLFVSHGAVIVFSAKFNVQIDKI